MAIPTPTRLEELLVRGRGYANGTVWERWVPL